MKVRLVFNDIIPFKGFKAITIWPWVFVRNDAMSRWTLDDERHETTHLNQQLEVMLAALGIVLILCISCIISWWWLFAVPFTFYALYAFEWLVRIPICGFDTKLAYYNISTEQEAYIHQRDMSYNYERRGFAWCKYLFRNSFKRDTVTRKIVKKQ